MEPITKFWMVWNPARYAPTYRHHSKPAARKEAERLSRDNPGQLFIVLAAVDAVISPVKPPETVKLVKPENPDAGKVEDDGIPF